MSKKAKHYDPGPAKALIDMEIKAALDEIPIRDFSMRLQRRLHDGVQKKAVIHSWRKKPVLVFGLLLIIAAAAAVLVLTSIFPSSFEKQVKSIDTFLRQAPGLQSYLNQKEQSITGAREGSEGNELEWTIKHSLFSFFKKRFPEKDLSTNLEKALRMFPVFRESYQTKKKGV